MKEVVMGKDEAKRIWRLDEVWKGKGDGARLKGVSLDVREGVTAVVGCSGAGKSTLLNLLVGFEQVDGGKVLGCGGDEKKVGFLGRLFGRRNKGGMVGWAPQGGGLWSGMTVRGHLEAVLPWSCYAFVPVGDGGREIVDLSGRDKGEVVGLWLKSFGLEALADRVVGRLSGGERARLSVVRALGMCSGLDWGGMHREPGIVVLDEPLVSVGKGDARGYWEVIRRWRGVTGGNVVFSTHFPELVIREADWIVCIEDGEVVWEGEVMELYERPVSEKLGAYLGELNWFEAGEMGVGEEGGRGVRPEKLRVEVVEGEGGDELGWIVVSSERVGAVVETVVRLSGGEQKRLLHVGEVLEVGATVRVFVVDHCEMQVKACI
ncbi:ABC transporter ATP-binding protein [Planctomycetota bacterium]|nr:ABC transporter ATP-binding protein [Planctomycetota bacterium]